MSDKLDRAFMLQRSFMDLLREHDRLPEFPVDLRTKSGQRLIKEYVWNLVEELAEASFTLKNRMHTLADNRSLDFAHYKEELGDAFAFFMEICILSDIGSDELYEQFVKKNQFVTKRLETSMTIETDQEVEK